MKVRYTKKSFRKQIGLLTKKELLAIYKRPKGPPLTSCINEYGEVRYQIGGLKNLQLYKD